MNIYQWFVIQFNWPDESLCGFKDVLIFNEFTSNWEGFLVRLDWSGMFQVGMNPPIWITRDLKLPKSLRNVRIFLNFLKVWFIRNVSKVGTYIKMKTSPVGKCWIWNDVHVGRAAVDENLCSLQLGSNFLWNVQAGRLTSLGSVLHEDGPLGWVKGCFWMVNFSPFCRYVFVWVLVFFCWFLWGEAGGKTPGWRGNFHSIFKSRSNFWLASGYVLVDVFVSRQIRQVLHFVRKMPIRTSLVFQAAGLQVLKRRQGDWQEIVVGFQLMFREPPQTGSSILQKHLGKPRKLRFSVVPKPFGLIPWDFARFAPMRSVQTLCILVSWHCCTPCSFKQALSTTNVLVMFTWEGCFVRAIVHMDDVFHIITLYYTLVYPSIW